MRRTPLKRGTKRLARTTRLRPVNPERAARLRVEQFGPQGEWLRWQPCATCSARAPSDPSHVKSRGAGGGTGDLVPQCRRCHRELHQVGVAAFGAKKAVDLGALAELYAGKWGALTDAEKAHWQAELTRRLERMAP